MTSLQRTLSRTISEPSRVRTRTSQFSAENPPFLDDNGHVGFAPGDPENPHNWSTAKRWRVTMTAVSLAAGLTITLFLLGYCAGPLIFAPLSEFFGRKWIFYSTFTLYLIFNFLCAFAPNFGSLLVGRFLTGTFVSAPLSNAPGVLADVWSSLERGNAMAAFSAMVYIGPAVGPVVAGFLELKEDWRWSFYVLLWLGGVTWLFMLTIPETYGPTLLLRKAQQIRALKISGYEEVKAPIEDAEKTLVDIYKVALTRPWVILFDTISFLVAIYMAVVYTLLYMLFSIYPIVFQERRGWNAGVGELPLLGTVVGAVFGGIVVFFDTRRRKQKIERGEIKLEDIEPEDRMILAIAGGIGFAVSMFWFAWTAEYNSVHWIVPTIAGGFLAASLLLIFVAYLNYLVDTYLMYAASAIAANTIARSACGAAAPLFTNQMFDALGIGGGGSLIGGVAALLAVIPFAFYKYGKQIRVRSKFAPTGLSPIGREKDEEEGREPELRTQSAIGSRTRPHEREAEGTSEETSEEITTESTGETTEDEGHGMRMTDIATRLDTRSKE